MKAIIRSYQSINRGWFRVSFAILTSLFFVIFPSCQKDEDIFLNNLSPEEMDLISTCRFPGDASILYYGHKTFTRSWGEPFTETQIIENPNFNCYDGNFVLKIKNGRSKKTRVSSAEIRIDGILVVCHSDFSKHSTFITKRLHNLTSKSILEVKLYGAPGGIIDLWIEGNLTVVTPLFKQIGPLLQGSVAPDLPATSNNGITGTWSPETINTSTKGIFTFTFTPAIGQCATTATINIEITNMGSVSDIDENLYNTIRIGDQWWMAENLKTTRYLNGDLIGTTTPATMDISSEITPKYQWASGGNEINTSTFGRLYTWYAITDSRNVCPEGWHVPSDAEWTTLTDYLTNNGYGYEGSGSDIAKSMAATSDWVTNTLAGNVGNDQASNNSSGFTALPSGGRRINGTFLILGNYSSWWSTTTNGTDKAWYRSFSSSSSSINKSSDNMKVAVGVRCVRD